MKKAATMIELIFTIVILAISMVTIPVILSNIEKTDEFSINQEALLAGATAIGNILTYNWDEKSTDLNTTLSPILDVSSSGDTELKRLGNTTWRKGSFKGEKRRKFYNEILFASDTLGSDAGDMDDIDDFIGNSSLTVGSTNFDYVKNIELSTNVYYISDNADYSKKDLVFTFSPISISNSTNIKLVVVSIKDKNTNEIISTYKSFASNIGETKLLSRNFN